jgi:hypothetical protein
LAGDVTSLGNLSIDVLVAIREAIEGLEAFKISSDPLNRSLESHHILQVLPCRYFHQNSEQRLGHSSCVAITTWSTRTTKLSHEKRSRHDGSPGK